MIYEYSWLIDIIFEYDFKINCQNLKKKLGRRMKDPTWIIT